MSPAISHETLLTQPPSSTVPSLSAGYPVRNALLEIAEQLQRVEKLPEVAPLDNQLPRVQNVSKPSPRKDVQPPRVAEPTPTPLSTLLQHSNLPKNARFRSTTDHRYPLRSKQRTPGTNFRHLAVQHLAAEELFQLKVHHI